MHATLIAIVFIAAYPAIERGHWKEAERMLRTTQHPVAAVKIIGPCLFHP